MLFYHRSVTAGDWWVHVATCCALIARITLLAFLDIWNFVVVVWLVLAAL